MTPKPVDRQTAAVRLRDALATGTDLTCEQAQDDIPALVEAELAGVDVDTRPEYAQVLRHIDQCEGCAELYATLAEDLALVVDIEAAVPNAQPDQPAFFKPARESENVVLRVLQGALRRFELGLQLPRLLPSIATLGNKAQATLFTDALPELAGSPVVSVSLHAEGDSTTLVVAIREPTSVGWHVQALIQGETRSAHTDQHGIARFPQVPVSGLLELTLICSELQPGG